MLDDQTSLIHTAGKLALETFMTTGVWQKWLPSLREDFRTSDGPRILPLDLRCGFSKEFMKNLDSRYITQVRFVGENRLTFHGHFGCGMMAYYTDPIDDEEPEGYAALRKKMEAGIDNWRNYRSFFFSVEGQVQFSFDDHTYRFKHLVQGKVEDFDLKFNELKVFQGDTEVYSEEEDLNSRVQGLRYVVMETGLKTALGAIAGYLQVPLSPFPSVEKCLGLSGDGSYMEIKDGYAIVGYDFKVRKTNARCLFETNI